MSEEFKHQLKPIGYASTIYPEKFGIPRQSGIVPSDGVIDLVSPFDDINALRGLEDYSHLWIIWQVSDNISQDGSWDWHPTVRPPALGGNVRKGVFATRSPLHPNGLALSCVKITGIEPGKIHIQGADIKDGTPILDIKPYVSYSDSHPDAVCGFANTSRDNSLEVKLADGITPESSGIPQEDLDLIMDILAQDPRPQYQDDPARKYGMRIKEYNVRFCKGDGPFDENVYKGTALIESIEKLDIK